jgi:hypothetical protein
MLGIVVAVVLAIRGPRLKPFFGVFERLFYLFSITWVLIVAIDLAWISSCGQPRTAIQGRMNNRHPGRPAMPTVTICTPSRCCSPASQSTSWLPAPGTPIRLSRFASTPMSSAQPRAAAADNFAEAVKAAR